MFGHPYIWKSIFLYFIHCFLSYRHAPLGTVCPYLFYSCPWDSSIHPWALSLAFSLGEWTNSLHSASPVTCSTMSMFFLARRPKQGMIPICCPIGTKQKGWVNSYCLLVTVLLTAWQAVSLLCCLQPIIYQDPQVLPCKVLSRQLTTVCTVVRCYTGPNAGQSYMPL